MTGQDQDSEEAAAGQAEHDERERAGAGGGRPEPTIVDIYVEIPKGSRNKYEWDTESGRFRLDRKLFSAVQYPGDYGFVAEAWGEDGDPLDALVILGDPTFPGCVISARVVGVFYMEDDKGRDTKIITVPSKDPQWAYIDELDDVPEHLLAEISHFFSIYKDLEQKAVTVHGYGSREDALAELARDYQRYKELGEPRPLMPWTPFGR
ncbi:MAG TPA: inorganic diphosphatase [Euzebyales bacterium]|nr:inorganic diphosphatase [Euzebyales bacterium]